MTGNSIWVDKTLVGGFGLSSVDDQFYDEFLEVAVQHAVGKGIVNRIPSDSSLGAERLIVAYSMI